MPYRRSASVAARLATVRARLLAAAAAQLAEGGYSSVTVAAVARRAALSTGGVYRHFPTKSALVAEVFRELAGVELAAVRAAADGAGDAGDQLARVVETFARRALAGRRVAYALLAEPVDAAVDAERLAFRRAYADVLAGLLAAGMAGGSVPPQPVVTTAAGLVGAIGEALVGPLSTEMVDADQMVGSLVTFCLRAAGLPDGARRSVSGLEKVRLPA